MGMGPILAGPGMKKESWPLGKPYSHLVESLVSCSLEEIIM